MDLGKAIRELRKTKGYLQKDFAYSCKLSTNALCQIELGNTFPQKFTIDKICKTLGITQSYLLIYSLSEDDVEESKRETFKLLKTLLVK